MRRFWGIAAFAFALVLTADTSAQAGPLKYVFVAVDAVAVHPGRVTITGILEGEGEPREVPAAFSTTSTAGGDALQACHRAALLALEKPGAYRLEVSGFTASTLNSCKLLRVDP